MNRYDHNTTRAKHCWLLTVWKYWRKKNVCILIGPIHINIYTQNTHNDLGPQTGLRSDYERLPWLQKLRFCFVSSTCRTQAIQFLVYTSRLLCRSIGNHKCCKYTMNLSIFAIRNYLGAQFREILQFY